MAKSMTPDLSIILPAWNEAHKIAADIHEAIRFLVSQGWKGEILVVDDGSTDGTKEAARIETPPSIRLRVLSYYPHRGKGYAVRQGILASRGRIVLFLDTGGCVPYADISRGITIIQSGRTKIVHGSRLHPQSRILSPQPLRRRIASFVFRMLIHALFPIPSQIRDTQCGLKIYEGITARNLYAACGTDGFLFDIEILLLALQAGFRVQEFPIHWRVDPDSRLSLWKAAFQLLPDLWRIYRKFHAPVGHRLQ